MFGTSRRYQVGRGIRWICGSCDAVQRRLPLLPGDVWLSPGLGARVNKSPDWRGARSSPVADGTTYVWVLFYYNFTGPAYCTNRGHGKRKTGAIHPATRYNKLAMKARTEKETKLTSSAERQAGPCTAASSSGNRHTTTTRVGGSAEEAEARRGISVFLVLNGATRVAQEDARTGSTHSPAPGRGPETGRQEEKKVREELSISRGERAPVRQEGGHTHKKK
ncbi:hypothetical protein NDU88_008972 [Pleurodeles waltl]|uniref:Uncharacterized protein n=1 Tax=Pleurodeles waltl TaxID=8319 RepID=A0AAV7RWC1_PLEWA|nr:hypothetical protein NDU88_008972 [Pleurodeles waltl]